MGTSALKQRMNGSVVNNKFNSIIYLLSLSVHLWFQILDVFENQLSYHNYIFLQLTSTERNTQENRRADELKLLAQHHFYITRKKGFLCVHVYMPVG